MAAIIKKIADAIFGKSTSKPGYLWNLVRTYYGMNATQRAFNNARKVDPALAEAHNASVEASAAQMKEAYGNSVDINSAKISPSETKDTGGNQYIMVPVAGPTTVINVVDEYEWTTSPKTARKNVPAIYLTELQPMIGAELNKALYSGLAAVDSVTTQAGNLAGQVNGMTGFSDATAEAAKAAKDKVKAAATSLLGKETTEKINKAYTDAKEKVKTTIKEVQEGAKSWANYNPYSTKALSPYNFLYTCQFTGWKYKLPYFSNETMNSPNNTFGNAENNSAMSYIADIASDVINGAASGMDATINTIYSNAVRSTEQTKMYNYADQGATLTIKFPLINTGDDTGHAAIRNYYLTQLLKFQSRPYRVSKNTLIPPYLYEVMIPGVRYIPYAYILNCKIELQGVRREYVTEILVEGKPTKTQFIMPEAYMVELQMQSLTNEPQNFMVESMLNEKKVAPEIQ